MVAMADGDIEALARIAGNLLGGDLVARIRDDEEAERITEAISPDIDPGLETVMIAPDYVGPRGRRAYTGADGFLEAWREWFEAFETYTIDLGEMTVGTEGRILTLGVQRGTTRTGGVEIEESAAAVWTLRDGKLVRAEFHLDPETAKRAAGLE